jgi:membrane-bound lytic murein transglycosylase D
MKRLLIILALVCSAAEAWAGQGADLLRELTPPSHQAAASADRQAMRLAALPRENRGLLPSLELPASEFFTVTDEETADDDFELRLPEEELPDSDIPLTVNEKVQYFIRYFQGPGRSSFARWLSRSERYIPMMREILRKEGLPEDLVYLAMIESGFTPHAVSVASAVGPWQFISGTGKRYDLRIDQWIDERRDPVKSTVAAALYLKELYALFNNDWYLAAAGYNAGENKILRAINMYSSRDFWQISQGAYLKRETKDYVPKLLAAAIIAKEPARYGFADVAYLPAIEFDTVTIPAPTDLELVARICDVPVQTIRELNPELRRWCTPPSYPDYQLKIPYGRKARFDEEYARIPAEQRQSVRTVHLRHKVARRETLSAIAGRYGTTEEELRKLNGLKKGQRLAAGRRILVPQVVSPAGSEPAVVAAKAPPVEEKSFTKYYTVKKGDTLESVARKFSISTRLLTAWNNLKAKGRIALRPGKRLIVAKFVEKKGAMVSEG